LTYHVVAGSFNAKAVAEAIVKGKRKASLKTVPGGEVTASLDGDSLIITDKNAENPKDYCQRNAKERCNSFGRRGIDAEII